MKSFTYEYYSDAIIGIPIIEFAHNDSMTSQQHNNIGIYYYY